MTGTNVQGQGNPFPSSAGQDPQAVDRCRQAAATSREPSLADVDAPELVPVFSRTRSQSTISCSRAGDNSETNAQVAVPLSADPVTVLWTRFLFTFSTHIDFKAPSFSR